MIRVVIFLIVVGLLAFGVTWFADRPGTVVVTWQGWRIETSLMMLGAGVVAAMVAVLVLWTLLRAILRSPFALRALFNHRRGVRAYEAISQGLIAVGSGDLAAARKHTDDARRMAPAEPLALLLSAQTAQLSGDREAADSAFRTMAGRTDTKELGLHGLYVEARRRNDHISAHAFAEEAARVNPSLGWAGRAVLEFRCLAGDWAGALALLEGSKRALDKETYKRQRAVLLTARAMAAEDTDRDNAKAFALEAAKLAPTFVPAASLAGRMLAEAGELRKATRILTKAWRANPHPELAQVFSHLRFGDAARDRLKRIEGLAKKVPGHVEGALALARAAINAQEFGKARAALSSFVAAPTKRVALMMAELERAATNDEGRVREWIARALNAAPDPAWTAGSSVSERWLPASPEGRLDAFEWRVPLTEIAPAAAPVIEPDAATEALPVSTAAEPPGPSVALVASADKADMAAAVLPVQRPSRAAPPKGEAVIPLVHAPDDPGPEAIEDADAQEAQPQSAGWRKIFE